MNSSTSDSGGHAQRRPSTREADATVHPRSDYNIRSESPIARRSSEVGEYAEQDPFLPRRGWSQTSTSSFSSLEEHEHGRSGLKTLWILPVVVMANLSRGMTMAPRVEMYTQVSCDLLTSNITTPPLLVHYDLRPYQLDDRPIREHRPIFAASLPEKCLHNPAVQSRAAEIQATLGTIVGVLSIVSAGYWGQFSDTFGRKKALAANIFGMAFHDVVYILVSIPDSMFKRNAWGFLIAGPVVEGVLGGLTTLHAAQNAYLADCAPTTSRSTIFAYYQGSVYVSLALGPQLAGIFLHSSGRRVFYLGLALNILCLCYTIFVLPETVTREMMRVARRSGQNESSGAEESVKEKWARRMRTARYKLLSPLVMFGPHRRPDGGWDLNLTLLVISQLTHLMSVGVVQVKFLYAQHTYSWNVKQLGYYISLLWTLRAIHLLLLLPTILHFVKPRPSPSLDQQLSQNLRFDYHIAQFSILIDMTAYILTLMAPAASQVLFVAFTCLSSFTAGVNPAIHSLAVSILQARDNKANVGQMFGSMSMLQAVAHTMQPLLFGMVYSHTVATFPKTIFALAAGLLLASVALLTLLRTNYASSSVIEEDAIDHDDSESLGEEETPFNIGQRR